MSKKEYAENYQLAQAQKILDVFQAANGRPARTIEELEKWVGSPEGQAALAIHHNPKTGKIDPF
jgi:hypothetical protein